MPPEEYFTELRKAFKELFNELAKGLGIYWFLDCLEEKWRVNYMDKIYGIFSGSYSDWCVHGYFTDKDLAERYCAKQNENLDSYDSYYVRELDDMQDDIDGLKDLKMMYRHEVVFDYNKENAIRKEPDRFSYYSGDKKERNVIRTYLNGWINFIINTDSRDREKAEKIACDMYAQFKYLYSELKDYRLAAEELVRVSGYENQIRK